MMLELAQSQTWSAEVGRSRIAVRVRVGEVWITRQGDPEDHILGAAHTLEVDGKGRVAVMALTPARLEITEPPPRALPAGRLSHALPR
jgi:hypothetical protein